MMKRILPGTLILLLPPPAAALCLLCSCTVSSDGVSFGDFNAFGSNVDVTGTVTVSCSGVVSLIDHMVEYDIALNKGLYSASFDPRQMGNGTYRLNYNLYRESTRNQIWGDGTGGTWVVSGTIPLTILLPSGSAEHVVYGRIPGPQATAHEGDYSDTITVTVTYDIQ